MTRARDTGRSLCYQAEGDLGHQEQVSWAAIMAMAARVMTDPEVLRAYPSLRGLRFRPVHQWKPYVGQYQPAGHRVVLCWGGRDYLTLLHEMAHAATPGISHQKPWREAFLFLAWRFMGEEMGRRLTASFINHGVVKPSVRLSEPEYR